MGSLEREVTMRSPYGLQIVENCVTCPFKEQRLFCNLPTDTLQALQAIKSTATYPKGAMLFVEGQESRGAFILCSGKAKLYTSSAEGRTIILRIVMPGEVLGLTSTIDNEPYEATVEILEPSQVNFLPRTQFLRFLTQHSDASLHVAKQLSANCAGAYAEIRCLGLSASCAEKLARMLLRWAAPELRSSERKEVRITLPLTHEEIAQMIGSSRETVTRLFAEFRRKQFVTIKGPSIWLRDVQALRKMAGE
jgi:CRP/FNR family transcriptional regulator, cyclic AMP receptor protein